MISVKLIVQLYMSLAEFRQISIFLNICTVVPSKSDSQVKLSLQLLSKPLTCTLHLSLCELIHNLCINSILRMGLIHK